MMKRRTWLAAGVGALASPAFAHHGWSGFDLDRPIYLEGRIAKLSWRNPHAELWLEPTTGLKVPADLGARSVPAQTAAVDGPSVLKRAAVPTRRDALWEIELAPLTRMQAWKVPEPKVGDRVEVVGYTAAGEAGAPVLRAEYLFVGTGVYGLRSSPA